ncbi:uncharacterized protein Triagg1_1456 [Trichoderma aggressivum f. europaeum]|uniref:SMP-30/Gluconolactonase/LRE-like region domain-containing protein n=1 Tax=Trichoderma aggressivum f. europaeum TaxID=173218 RepID=A0AAE1JH03_9HYPO|nr:hypothetical protein Triagg1_1456 [Trichoderma aggressivum f. europaeum]
MLQSIITILSAAVAAIAVPTDQSVSGAPIKTVVQLQQNGTQFENLITRTDGTLLATRIDIPEIWWIDPAYPTHTRVITIEGDVVSILGITETSPNVYAFNAGNITSKGAVDGSFQIWGLDLTHGEPQTYPITRIDRASFLNGIATLDPKTVVVTDTNLGLLWKVDISTGYYEILLQDPSMAIPAGSSTPAGINGVHIQNGYLYFTNTAQMSLSRFPIAKNGTKTGGIQRIAEGFMCDDFDVQPDGTVYLPTTGQNTVIRVSLDGRVQQLAGTADSLAVGGGTAAQFGRGPHQKKRLFVTTSGDRFSPINGTIMEPGKLVAVDLSAVIP